MIRNKVIFAVLGMVLLVPSLLMAWPQPGTTAPNFTLPDTAGVSHTLNSYRGHVVQLFFWQST